MKRILAIILAGVLCISVCACGKSETGSGDTPVIKMYMPVSQMPDLDIVLEEANKIIEPEIGAKLDLQFIDEGAYSERIKMMMASGEKYEICFTGYLNKYIDAVSKGGFMKLDELLETTPLLKESVPDYLWDSVEYEGGIYAVPNEQINAKATVPFTFKDLADKYELDVDSITEHTDLEPYLEKIKNGEPQMIPYRTGGGGGIRVGDTEYEEIIYGIGFARGDKDAKICYVYDQPEFKEGARVTSEWIKKGYIRPDVLSAGDDTLDYKSGKYAVWCAVYKPGVEADFTSQFGREVVAMKNVATPYVTQSACAATMFALGRNCRYPEQSIKLLEMLNTNKELYNLLSYGIEGKHYELTEENKVKYIEGSGYDPKASWKFGNQFNAYVVDGTDANVWEETKKMNEEAEKSILMNFVLDTSDITTEISNFSSVCDEYSYVIFGLSTDYLDFEKEYREKLSNVGIETIIDEIQRQVDECLGK